MLKTDNCMCYISFFFGTNFDDHYQMGADLKEMYVAWY